MEETKNHEHSKYKKVQMELNQKQKEIDTIYADLIAVYESNE
jgi:hypothetical protein